MWADACQLCDTAKSRTGVPSTLCPVGTAPMTSRADVAAWIARLEAAPGFWRDHIANARRGVASGFVQPRTTAQAVLDQAREMAAAPVEGDAALAPFDRLPEALSAQEKAQARARGIAAVAELRRAQAEFAAFLETEYLPAARDGLAARDLDRIAG